MGLGGSRPLRGHLVRPVVLDLATEEVEMNLREAAQQALKSMDDHMYRADTHEFYEAKEALRAALAEPAERNTVIALAREVGLWEMLEGYSSEYGSLNAEDDCLGELQRFAALVAAAEREEIRQYADEFIGSEAERNNMFSEGYDHALYHLKKVLDGRDRRQQ